MDYFLSHELAATLVDQVTENGVSPLLIAIDGGYNRIVRSLIIQGKATLNVGRWEAFAFTCNRDLFDSVCLMAAVGAPREPAEHQAGPRVADILNWKRLQFAVAAQYDEVLLQLLERGHDPHDYDTGSPSPMTLASTQYELSERPPSESTLAIVKGAMRPWIPSSHRYFGPQFRKLVTYLHYVMYRLRGSENLPLLPLEMWHCIMSFLLRAHVNEEATIVESFGTADPEDSGDD